MSDDDVSPTHWLDNPPFDPLPPTMWGGAVVNQMLSDCYRGIASAADARRWIAEMRSEKLERLASELERRLPPGYR